MPRLSFVALGESVVRGVNLGGWLVLEPWITPGIFATSIAADEYTYCTNITTQQKKLLKLHRDTFITEADFKWLATRGISAVRLPVGYWLFGDFAPFQKTVQYVDKAFTWAAKYKIRILLDLHGAPGSQNGRMHSGMAGEVLWHVDLLNIQDTLSVLTRLGKRYGKHPALLGISVLNEPSPDIPVDILERFYKTAIKQLRPLCNSDVWFVCSDAFQPRRWDRRMHGRQIYFDYHHYQLFGWIDTYLPESWQLFRAKYLLPRNLKRMQKHHKIMVGEWSGALHKRGNQRGDSIRYINAQRRAFDAANVPYFYWTYKTEYGGVWSFKDLVEHH